MKVDFSSIKEFGNIEFLARQMVEGFITGLHKSPYHGFSVEFAEHQLYNTGESTKHIDWKVYARTDRLYTKRYEEETNLRCMLLIDHSPSMYYPKETKGKLLFSILAGASIAYLLHKQRDAVGLCTFSDEIEDKTEIKSTRTHLNKILLLLENLMHTEKPAKATNVAKVLHEVAETIHRRSLIILFSDMFDSDTDIDDLFSALQHLKHKEHEVLLFHVTDYATEHDLNFEERPYEFIDLESGEKIKLNPSQIRSTYIEEVDRFYKELKIKCAQYKIDFIEADIRQDMNSILNAYLIKRTRIR